MEEAIKLIVTLIVLGIIINQSASIINSFNHYRKIKELSSDLSNVKTLMNNLAVTASNGWVKASIKLPTGYYLSFNNETDTLDVSGEENFSLKMGYDLKYELRLEPGLNIIQLHYGSIPFNELKSNTVVFE